MKMSGTQGYNKSWSSTADLWAGQHWVSVKDMGVFLTAAAEQSFSTVEGRNQLMSALGKTYKNAPFDHDIRFPEWGTFIRINDGNWPAKLKQIHSALSYKQASEQGQIKSQDTSRASARLSGGSVRVGPHGTEEEEEGGIGQNEFNKALVAYEFGIQHIRDQLGTGAQCFNRKSLEEYLRLTWE